MRQAAQLWAEARNAGLPTASDAALDGDVILAAQVVTAVHDGHDTVVATTNVKHLKRFVAARLWREILPGLSDVNACALLLPLSTLTIVPQSAGSRGGDC
jgi:hypothetical protein